MPGYKSIGRAIRYGGYWVYPGDTKAREYYPNRDEALKHAQHLRELKKKNPNAFPLGKIKIEKAR
jgi:hypothetical protein